MTEVSGPLGGFLSCDQAAKFLGVKPKTVRTWINDGLLRAYKIGRQWRILKDDLLAYMTKGANGPLRSGGTARQSDAT